MYTLQCIVHEIMALVDSVINGSSKKRVGSFMVQGVAINGKFRPFLTLSISSESVYSKKIVYY